jgi:hypothetical protein
MAVKFFKNIQDLILVFEKFKIFNFSTSYRLFREKLHLVILNHVCFTDFFFSPNAFFMESFFAETIFHRKHFSPKSFFTENIFRRKHFSPKTFFAEIIFHRKHFSPKTFFTENIFSPNAFFTECIFHRMQEQWFTYSPSVLKQSKRFLVDLTWTRSCIGVKSFS